MPTTRKSAKRTGNKPVVRKTEASARKTTKAGKASTSRTSTQGRGNARKTAKGSAASRGKAGPSAAKRATGARGKAPDAIELLTKDHAEVKKMFPKAERMEGMDGGAGGDRAMASRDGARKTTRRPGPGHRATAGRDASTAGEDSSDHESDPMGERGYGRTTGDVAEDTEQPGRSGRFARADGDDNADTEVDVETPRDAARREAR